MSSPLAWRQNEALQLELYLPAGGGTVVYTLDPDATNFLAAARVVEVTLRLQGQPERVLQANFRGLRPVADKKRPALTRDLGGSPESLSGDYCAIARGESFSQRWLTPDGWAEEAFWFALQRISTVKLQTTEPVNKVNTQPMETISPEATSPYPAAQDPNSPFVLKRALGGLARVFLTFTLLAGLSCLLCNFIHTDRNESTSRDIALVILNISFLLCFVVSVITFLRLIHRGWQMMQEQEGSLHPETAVWLLLVPGFHIYWAFRAVRGLFPAVNRQYAQLDPTLGRKLLSPSLPTLMILFATVAAVMLLITLIRLNTGLDVRISLGLFYIASLPFLLFLLLVGLKLKVGLGRIIERKFGQARN